jgi:NADPH-dependent 2,4-dienoyl-CoA reductase/sulfur reductase-like enzyme
LTQLRVVVGSGPNAVAVTHALLQRGFPVTIFDVGETLDPETAEIVLTMSRQEPDEWSREHKALIRQVDFNADPGLAPKRAQR